jgi:polyribonucleotide nucleotidyltransferase
VYRTGISKPRAVMKSDTPRVKEMLIPKLLRSKLIGPSGATLKRISELTGCTIELSDGNDMAAVFAPSESAMKATEELIVEALGMNPLASIMQPVTKDKFGVGQDVTAKVSHITQFGAVVEVSMV